MADKTKLSDSVTQTKCLEEEDGVPDLSTETVRPLVVRCGALGDMVLLSPLLRLLAARYGSPVDLISSGAWTVPLLASEPSLGHMQVLRSRKTPYLLCPSQWQLVRWLRNRRRGPVYLCDVTLETRRLLERGGVLQEDLVDYSDENRSEPMLWPDRWMIFGQRNPARNYPVREVDPALFRLPRLVVSEAAREDFKNWRAEMGLKGALVLFQPGNKRTHKRGKLMTADHPKHWDPEHWAKVGRAVLEELPGDAHLLLCGSPREYPLLEDIRNALGGTKQALNVARDLPIPRLLALLEQAHSMVSVDTGPAHAAAALGCPLVVLFGNVSISSWHPLGPGAIEVLGGQRGEKSRVSDIPPDAVIDAWRRLHD